MRAARDAPIRVVVREEADVFIARARSRELALDHGFPAAAAAAIATAVSEIARNIVEHAGEGEIFLTTVLERARRGVVVLARDPHPGIVDVAVAMQDGYSTGGGLGLGLPSARRLMDEFTIVSAPGSGTTVTMKKWVHVRRE